MIIAELCERAGLPAGVLNVVHGSVPTVNSICDHPDIKAISFVGGDRAGHHIYERSGLSSGHNRAVVKTFPGGQRTANGYRYCTTEDFRIFDINTP